MAGDRFEQTTFDRLITEGALEIGDGYRAKNEELGGDGLIFLRAGHVTDTHIDFDGVERFRSELEPCVHSKLARPGDAVITTKGNSTGRTTFVLPSMPPFVYSPHLSYWRSLDPNRITGGFLRYWCKGPEFAAQLSAMKASTDMAPYLSLVDQKRLEITLPPVGKQRAIALILGTLDDKIALNRQMNETLEAIARALFKSWFVDFDPVRAKLEGRDPGLPKVLAELFPARLANSGLGEIPEGWTVETLADHFEAVKGVSYKGSGLGDGGVPLHNLNSIYEGGGYKYEGIKYYSGEYAERHMVNPGDLIVANTEQGHDRLLIGYAAIVPRVFGERAIASHHIFRLRQKPKSALTAGFLCHLLNSPQMHDMVSGFANGTTVNMLPIDGVQKPPIVVPPPALVETFDKLAMSTELRKAELVIESRTLAALRDTLLPKLISGELRVKEAGGLSEETARC
jgi:type I restriction enzyme S subunit